MTLYYIAHTERYKNEPKVDLFLKPLYAIFVIWAKSGKYWYKMNILKIHRRKWFYFPMICYRLCCGGHIQCIVKPNMTIYGNFSQPLKITLETTSHKDHIVEKKVPRLCSEVCAYIFIREWENREPPETPSVSPFRLWPRSNPISYTDGRVNCCDTGACEVSLMSEPQMFL